MRRIGNCKDRLTRGYRSHLEVYNLEDAGDALLGVLRRFLEGKVYTIDEGLSQRLIVQAPSAKTGAELDAELGALARSLGVDLEEELFAAHCYRNAIPTVRESVSSDEGLLSARRFASHLRANQTHLWAALEEYTTFSAFEDEFTRAIHLLENLADNRQYLSHRVGNVIAFLPQNQLLYSTVYAGVIPSLISTQVTLRPCEASRPHYRKLLEAANLNQHFPNIRVSTLDRRPFLATFGSETEVAIFTGTHANAETVRRGLPRNCLFILNGSGHNPVLVCEDADLERAAQSVVRLCFLNQGQDCAAPNSILVHESIVDQFTNRIVDLAEEYSRRTGPGRFKVNLIGPNTNPNHALTVAKHVSDNREYVRFGGALNPATGLIFPTVFVKPLSHGGWFQEFFAPVVMIQPFRPFELDYYFNDPRYRTNAMYLTVFGASDYVRVLLEERIHSTETVLYNTDLHIEEKGTKPYGGFGAAASSISFSGVSLSGPILPVREIWRYIIEPALRKVSASPDRSLLIKLGQNAGLHANERNL